MTAVASGRNGTGCPPTVVDRGLVWDSGLYARHTAAMNIVRRAVEDDGELLLSYVIWPTESIDSQLEQAARQAVAVSAKPTADQGD